MGDFTGQVLQRFGPLLTLDKAPVDEQWAWLGAFQLADGSWEAHHVVRIVGAGCPQQHRIHHPVDVRDE